MQDSANADSRTPSEPSADVILNRVNVALARSQRLINSWLPPAPPAESSTREEAAVDDDEALNEVGGIGSKAARDDVDAFGLPRKKHSTNDRLLEQILGRKGAEAKRRKDAKEGKGGSGHSKPVALVEKPKEEKKRAMDSDSEEEGGRASAFKSRKIQPATIPEDEARVGAESMLDRNSPIEEPVEGSRSKPSKKKTSSYLDEVLANKSKKKKKRSKGGQQNG